MSTEPATFLLQWAAGGLMFAWVTTRRREVGPGYGWLLRGLFGALALGAAGVMFAGGVTRGAVAGAAALVAAVLAALASVSSWLRRSAGVTGVTALRTRRRARIDAMLGRAPRPAVASGRAEFDPRLDLAAPVLAAVALGVALDGGGGLGVARAFVGAAFVGCVTDAMLLGHWYLVQPGLDRAPLRELVRWLLALWPIEVALFLWPPGMGGVIAGTIDDGYSGLVGWVWVASAIATLVLAAAARSSLGERSYSAVMAATGLLYLALLSAFGTDLLPRVVLGD